MPKYELENLPLAPEGTFKFLEELSGKYFLKGEDWLGINKEEICEETGGSCMAFRLVRYDRDNSFDYHGHLTDKDEVVFLFKHTLQDPDQSPDINEAISEIQKATKQAEILKVNSPS